MKHTTDNRRQRRLDRLMIAGMLLLFVVLCVLWVQRSRQRASQLNADLAVAARIVAITQPNKWHHPEWHAVELSDGQVVTLETALVQAADIGDSLLKHKAELCFWLKKDGDSVWQRYPMSEPAVIAE